MELVERLVLKTKNRAQWYFQKAEFKQLKWRLESAKAMLVANVLNLTLGFSSPVCCDGVTHGLYSNALLTVAT